MQQLYAFQTLYTQAKFLSSVRASKPGKYALTECEHKANLGSNKSVVQSLRVVFCGKFFNTFFSACDVRVQRGGNGGGLGLGENHWLDDYEVHLNNT